MAKGKYKARKQTRDSLQLEADLVRVRAQLLDEKAKLDKARQRALVDQDLRAALAAAIAARDAICGPHIARIAADRDVVGAATYRLAEVRRSLTRHSEKICQWGWTAIGPEKFYAVLTGDRAYLNDGVVSARLDDKAIEAIQRSRGIRRESAPDYSNEQKDILGELAAGSAGVSVPDEFTAWHDGDWETFSEQVGADDAAQIAVKAPMPWLDIAADSAHPVSRILGADPPPVLMTVEGSDELPSISELSTASAASRDAAVAAGVSAFATRCIGDLQLEVNLAGRSQISSMTTADPPYPAPVDAASLHAWYALAALGAWGRCRSDDTKGRIAVAAAAAIPYWLPPGHTIAYLDSEPLSEDDIGDIRLPFANVLVTFAEPARLQPLSGVGLSDDDPRLEWIDHLVKGRQGLPDLREMALAGTNNFTETYPGLWDVIATRGAHIEGVLLLADAVGQLDDHFAWCIAIPSKTPGAVIGRWVIPASRSTTHYQHLVANAAAVAAWADWHRPGKTSDSIAAAESLTETHPAQRHASETVHVLNVTATTPPADEAHPNEGTGRTVAPHRRRGHWRRQHYGPARSQTRRVRIAPVLVNAGHIGDKRPQIYRLPAPLKV